MHHTHAAGTRVAHSPVLLLLLLLLLLIVVVISTTADAAPQTSTATFSAATGESFHDFSARSATTTDDEDRLVLRVAGPEFQHALLLEAIFAFPRNLNDVVIEYYPIGGERAECRVMDYLTQCDNPYTTVSGTDTADPAYLDIAISDVVLPPAAYDAYPDLQMLPIFGAAVAPIHHVLGFDSQDNPLVLSRQVLADIFSGNITMWSDQRILDLNPTPANQAALVAAGEIIVVVREDRATSTKLFKSALQHFDPSFAAPLDETVSWPAALLDHVRYREGEDGVTAHVEENPSTISYAVLEEAIALNVHTAALTVNNQDRSDGYVLPTAESTLFAMFEEGMHFGNNGDDPERLTASLLDASSARSWPIVEYTYVVVRLNTLRPGATCETRAAALDFLEFLWESELVINSGFESRFSSVLVRSVL